MKIYAKNHRRNGHELQQLPKEHDNSLEIKDIKRMMMDKKSP